MADLARLVAKLEIETAKYHAELERAQKRLQRFDKGIGDTMKRIGKAGALAAVAVGGALVAMGKKAIDQADQFAKLSQSTGFSVESLSKLSYGANLAGASIEELTPALARLSKSAVDSARGLSAPARAFDALGVSTQNADGTMRDSEALLLDVAESFAKLEDGTLKSALAQDIFGRAGAKLIPFLNEGAAGLERMGKEATAAGAVISTKAAKAAERFNDNIDKMKMRIMGVINEGLAPLLPLLAEYSDEAVAGARASDELNRSTQHTANTFKALTIGLLGVKSGFVGLGTGIGGLAAALNRLNEGIDIDDFFFAPNVFRKMGENAKAAGAIINESFGDASSSMTDDIERMVRVWNAGTKALEQLSVPQGKPKGGNPLGGMAESAEKALAQVQGMVLGISQEIATLDMGAAAAVEYRIAHGDLAELFASAGKGGERWKQILVDVTAEQERLAKSAQRATEREAQLMAEIEEGAAIYEATRTPVEKYGAEIERLNDQLARGVIQPDTYKRAVEMAQDAFDEMSVYADQAARNMQDAFADFLFDPFEDGLKGMLKSFADTIRRMLAQQAAAEIFTSKAEGGLGLGDFFSGLFSGTAPTGKASGGPVTSGKPYIVGEKGPEFFVPQTNGTVVPNGMMGVTLHNTQNISGVGLSAEQLGAVLTRNNRELVRLIQQQQQRSGQSVTRF